MFSYPGITNLPNAGVVNVTAAEDVTTRTLLFDVDGDHVDGDANFTILSISPNEDLFEIDINGLLFFFCLTNGRQT